MTAIRGVFSRVLARGTMVALAASGLAVAGSPAATITAHAAGVTTIQGARYLGSSQPSSAVGSGDFVDSRGDATARTESALRHHDGEGGGATVTATPVVATTGATGFNGVSHRDQRTAGTGIYRNTQFSLEPPDQALCVGNGFVLEGVNTAFRVYSTAGAPLTAVTAYNQFFGVAPEINRVSGVRGDFTSDPKCNFDTAANRWYMTMLQVDPAPSPRTHAFLAVSQGGDPTAGWNLFSIDTTDDGLNGTPNNSTAGATCPCLGDQPLLGVNADGIYISTNEYQNSGNFGEIGAQIYAISKDALLDAASHANLPVVHINAGALPLPRDYPGPWDSIQPATSPTTDTQSRGVEYFLNSLTNAPATEHRIGVWTLSGTKSLNKKHPEVSLDHVLINTLTYGYQPPYGAPGFGSLVATQKDGPRPLGASVGEAAPFLNGNDTRMNQVVYANGKLWGGLNTALANDSAGNPRVGFAYFQVAPGHGEGHGDGHGNNGAELLNQGYVTVAGQSTMFPSIGVNADGNGAISFTLVGPDYFPSAAFVRVVDDGGVVGGVQVSGAGVGADDGFTGYVAFTGGNVGRWGDYSAAVATPDGSIWMASEYIPGARTVLANWGTYITKVSVNGDD